LSETITIESRYFAAMREALGRSSERLAVPAGTTASDVMNRLVEEQPKLDRMRSIVMVMVNQAYASPDTVLNDGDELAFIPPVSGGSGPGFYRVQEAPIDTLEVETMVMDPGAGAVVTFSGTVRDHGRGQSVSLLEYEAYAPAAEKMMAQVGEEIAARWPVTKVAMVHRIGALPVGEVSVVIAISSAHRDAAFDASRYAIERLKEIVPIWKKEHYTDGAAWLGSEHDYQVEIGRLPAEPRQ
jgi:molybdopterin converting factor subunit 1